MGAQSLRRFCFQKETAYGRATISRTVQNFCVLATLLCIGCDCASDGVQVGSAVKVISGGNGIVIEKIYKECPDFGSYAPPVFTGTWLVVIDAKEESGMYNPRPCFECHFKVITDK